MSVNVILYKNTSEQNRLDKTNYLTKYIEITGELRNDVNILTPVIEIYLLTESINFVNYIYIQEFNRYYFVNSIDICNGEITNTPTETKKVLIRYYLQVDVLMSWKDDIKKLSCYISRQENRYDTLYVDTKLPTKSDIITNIYRLSAGSVISPFSTYDENSPCYIVTYASNSIRYGTSEQYQDKKATPYNKASNTVICTGKALNELINVCYGTLNANAAITALWNGDRPFISTKICAFTLDLLKIKTASVKTIIMGSAKLTLQNSLDEVYFPNNSYTYITNLVEYNLSLSNYFNFDDFKTFNPYSSVELHIPFVGYVTLKNADILKFNGTFYGRYLIDLINGYSKFQLYTYIDANGNVINPATLNDTQKELFRFIVDEFEANCCYDIIIGQTNNTDMIRKQLGIAAKAISFIGGLGINSNAASAVEKNIGTYSKRGRPTKKQQAATQAKLETFKANENENISNFVNDTVSGALSETPHNSQFRTPSGNSYIDFSSSVYFYLKITKYNIKEPNGFSKLYGKPANYITTIDTLNGYTEVGAVHVENIDCLEDERDEIENTLKSGFIA